MRVGNTYVFKRSKGGRGSSSRTEVLFVWLLCLLLSGGVLLFAGWAERERQKMTLAFSEASDSMHLLTNDQVQEHSRGKLIHFTTDKIYSGDDNHLRDIDFGISVEGAVKLSREVEYCQWVESYTERTIRSDDDTETVERTYYYTLLWTPMPVVSVFFDQPLTHHNPQRDPYPSYTGYASSARVGTGGEDGRGYLVPQKILERGIYEPRTVFFDHNSLGAFVQTPAVQAHGFRYIGNGYFYSPYDSTVGAFARVAGRLLEGTLFDFQLGELFSTCTPGDIRLRFVAGIPREASVIGVQADEKGTLSLFTAKSNGYQLALFHEGRHEPEAMLKKELNDFFWTVLFSRLLLFVWSLAVASAGFGFQGGWGVFLGGLFFTGTLLGALSCFFWGVNLSSLALFGLSFGGFLISYSSFRSPGGRHSPTSTSPSSKSE